MAEPHPTIRYVERSGTPVLEVGGSWTVFSMRGLARQVGQARNAGQGRGPQLVDASAGIPLSPASLRPVRGQ